MKLNNSGWSFSSMMMLLCILVLSIVLVFYFIKKSNINTEKKYNINVKCLSNLLTFFHCGVILVLLLN